MKHVLIVGLGNPGKKYEQTRHNIGFLVVDELKKRVLPAGVKFLKPDTFMNLSGEAVADAIHQTNMTAANIIVVYDDADLPFGTIRFRSSGSAGGHNGIKSIIQHLGTEEFARVKIGIGRSGHAEETLDKWVLGAWSKEEAAALPELVARAADDVEKHLP